MLLVALLNAQYLIRRPFAWYQALALTQLILLDAGLNLDLVDRPQHLRKPVLAQALALEIIQLRVVDLCILFAADDVFLILEVVWNLRVAPKMALVVIVP